MANPEIQPMLNAIGFVPDSTTDVKDEIQAVSDFKLIGNYPNPFNPNTTIVFSLPKSQNIHLTVYNNLGQVVKEITEEELPAGFNEIKWNGDDQLGRSVSSGIYFYQIKSADNFLTGKMVLTK